MDNMTAALEASRLREFLRARKVARSWVNEHVAHVATPRLNTLGRPVNGISKPMTTALNNAQPRWAWVELDRNGLPRHSKRSFALQMKTAVSNTHYRAHGYRRRTPSASQVPLSQLGDYLAEHSGASFAELSRDIAGFDGDKLVYLGPQDEGLLLWHRISAEGHAALVAQLEGGRVRLHKTISPIVLLDDFDAPNYRETDLVSRAPGWLPVVVAPSAGDSSESWDSRPLKNAQLTLGNAPPRALPFRSPREWRFADTQGRWSKPPMRRVTNEARPDGWIRRFNKRWGRPMTNDLTALTASMLAGARPRALERGAMQLALAL